MICCIYDETFVKILHLDQILRGDKTGFCRTGHIAIEVQTLMNIISFPARCFQHIKVASILKANMHGPAPS